METNNHKITSYDSVLDDKFGKEGTPERNKANQEAREFYSSTILHNARKEARMTQAELAKRINSSKSYISRIENGLIEPSAGTFFHIIEALGMRVEIVRPLQ